MLCNLVLQVVAGYNVFLVLELGESNLRKGEINNGSCELNQNSVNCVSGCSMFN
jgi:hypothetical protein